MGEHKATIMLMLAGLIMFSLFVIFNTDTLGPLLDKIGINSNKMVDGVFTGITSPPDGSLSPKGN